MIPRIRRVYIQNFRSIERTVVDLETLTVLVGPNGVGKSNFVQALHWIRSFVSGGEPPRVASIRPRWAHEPAPFGVEFDLDLGSDLTAKYSFVASLTDSLERFPSVLHERCSVVRAGSEVNGFESREGRFLREIPGIRAVLAPDRLALTAAAAVPELRPVYDLLAGIRWYSIQPERVGEGSFAETSGDELSPTGDNAADVLKAIEQHLPEDHARIERLLSQAVNGIESVGVRDLHRLRQLEFFTKENLPFHGLEMSDGTLRLLGLLLAIYQPRRPKVVVFEEPEATVHPAIAELLMQVFRDASRRQQVILTTHSPDLLDAKELSDEQIRVVSQRQGRTVIAPLGPASRQAIRERLYTPGELLRLSELDDNAEGALASAATYDPFADNRTTT